MPYIKLEDRHRILHLCGPLENAGELNYAITMIVQEYLDEDPDYQSFNDAIGALESAKLELYRRQVAPYESMKAKENGDVYPSKDVNDMTTEELREMYKNYVGW